MKNKFLLILVAAAAFAAVSCVPALELTSPDRGDFNDAKSMKYDSNAGTVTWGSLFTIDASRLDITADPDGVNKTIIINLNNSGTYYLDLVRKSDAEFERGLREGFQFISFTSVGTSPVDLAGEAAITVNSVTRSGNTAYVQLVLPATISTSIQVRALANKLTYNGGNKMDGDGNFIPGEEFYDDYYSSLLSVTGASGVSPAYYKQKYTITFNASPVIPDYTGYTFKVPLTYNGYYSGNGDTTDYTSTLSGLYKAQKYNRTSKQWEEYPSVTWARQTDLAQYVATISGLANTDALRFVMINPSGFETAVDFFGHKQRIYNGSNSRDKVYELSGFTQVVNGMDSKSFSSTQRSANTFTLVSAEPTLPGNRGVVLSFSFPASAVGDLGLNDIDLASFRRAFKIGTTDDGTGTFIPIKSAELVYDPFGSYGSGFSSGVPNRLNVYLDSAYVKNNSTTRYLYLSPGYGYKGDAGGTPIAAGVFGDYNKYDTVIDNQTDWDISTTGLAQNF